jgi:hypothetical protein
VDWSALLQYGGFATLGIVMTLAMKMFFDAWKKGELVSRPIWERSESRSDTLALQLGRNTEALIEHTKVMATLAAAGERQAKALERLASKRTEP